MFEKLNMWARRYSQKRLHGNIRHSGTGFIKHGKSEVTKEGDYQVWRRPNGKVRRTWMPQLSTANPFPKKHKKEDKTAFKARRAVSLRGRRIANRNRARCYQ